MSKDNINPDHYKNSTSLECIEAMQIIFGEVSVCHFCVLNAFKYIWRWKNKNGAEDLDKAKWYINKAFEIGVPDVHTEKILQRMSDYLEKIVWDTNQERRGK